jgi:hypothetical protein
LGFVWPVVWLGIVVLVYATEGRSTARELRMRLFGTKAVGRVTKVKTYSSGTTVETIATAAYTSAEGEHTVSGTVPHNVETGQEITVRYLPAQPEVASLSEGVVMLVFKTFVLSAFAVVLAFIALITIAGA